MKVSNVDAPGTRDPDRRRLRGQLRRGRPAPVPVARDDRSSDPGARGPIRRDADRTDDADAADDRDRAGGPGTRAGRHRSHRRYRGDRPTRCQRAERAGSDRRAGDVRHPHAFGHRGEAVGCTSPAYRGNAPERRDRRSRAGRVRPRRPHRRASDKQSHRATGGPLPVRLLRCPELSRPGGRCRRTPTR